MEGLTVRISQFQTPSLAVPALFWLLLADLLSVRAHSAMVQWYPAAEGTGLSHLLSALATPWCCSKLRWLFSVTSGFQGVFPCLSGLILVWEEPDSMILAGPSQLGIFCDSMMWLCFMAISGAAHCLSFSILQLCALEDHDIPFSATANILH